LLQAIRSERNVAIIVVCLLLTVMLSALLRLSAIEWCLVAVCCALVLVTELLNTAIEAVTDLACEQQHPLAAIAKDTASAATLVAVIASLVVGLIIFAPKIVGLLC